MKWTRAACYQMKVYKSWPLTVKRDIVAFAMLRATRLGANAVSTWSVIEGGIEVTSRLSRIPQASR